VFFKYCKSLIFFVPTLALALLCTCSVAQGDSVHTTQRTLTQLAPGIYAIRHKDSPSGYPSGNTTVIIGDREVLVVDSCSLGSETRQDIAQIRQWTDKPVHYLVNTHWHNDHTEGNSIYADVFPSLSIIAQTQTKMMSDAYLPGEFAAQRKEIDKLKEELETGKGDDGKPLTEAQKTEAKTNLTFDEEEVSEFTDFVFRPANVTFEHELDLDLGNREVQIKYLGRGNTAGDAVLFLPKEKILITGDIVVHPVPYLCSGYPSEWIETLQRMIDLGPQVIVPGHGEVLYDTSYLVKLQNLLATVVSAVRNVFYIQGNGVALGEVRKKIDQTLDFDALKRKFDGGDPDNFNQSKVIQTCLVRNVYYEEVLR
jgi:cyclase